MVIVNEKTKKVEYNFYKEKVIHVEGVLKKEGTTYGVGLVVDYNAHCNLLQTNSYKPILVCRTADIDRSSTFPSYWLPKELDSKDFQKLGELHSAMIKQADTIFNNWKTDKDVNFYTVDDKLSDDEKKAKTEENKTKRLDLMMSKGYLVFNSEDYKKFKEGNSQ